jgi:hypothetical protein
MISRRFLPLAFVWLAVCAVGCSFSDSSESISKSVSSPFRSSSDSSGGSDQTYRSDVRDYTAAYVKSGGDFDGFRAQIAKLAAKHGITDWELDTNTFVGIGEGLKKAGVNPTELSAWKTNLASSDLSRANAIQQGYDAK